jgi:hypothetical protein
MRMPIILRVDVLNNNNSIYFGIGNILSFNYAITKNIYTGINLEMNYCFDSQYEEIVGYKDATIGVNENGILSLMAWREYNLLHANN